jgi:hypothetical protein
VERALVGAGFGEKSGQEARSGVEFTKNLMFAGDSVETAIRDDRNSMVRSQGRKPVLVSVDQEALGPLAI